MRLKDKVAIITGAGRGIGRATAIRFAKEGALVVAADIDADSIQEVVDEINLNGKKTEVAESVMAQNGGSKKADTAIAEAVQAIAVKVDVTSLDSVQEMLQQTLDAFGRVDVLINNAGIVRDAQLVKMTEDMFDLVIDINLKGVFNCTKVVVPAMIEQKKGVILSTASVVAPYGNFGQTNYVASKAGVVGMTKVWAKELGRKGIRVNAVAPGFINTRLTAGIPDAVVEKLLQRVPLGRFGDPEDIANAFLWLASDEAGYVTGHVFAVDGGTVI